jgi:hypothetical protein
VIFSSLHIVGFDQIYSLYYTFSILPITLAWKQNIKYFQLIHPPQSFCPFPSKWSQPWNSPQLVSLVLFLRSSFCIWEKHAVLVLTLFYFTSHYYLYFHLFSWNWHSFIILYGSTVNINHVLSKDWFHSLTIVHSATINMDVWVSLLNSFTFQSFPVIVSKF